MSDEQLLTISTFARAVGVPASALRHYAAEQVLVPADVDPTTGYRYYAPSQIEDGVLLRRMRRVQLPLAVMRQVLTGSPREGAALLGELLTDHGTSSRRREEELGALREQLDPALPGGGTVRASVPGTALAAAIAQVLPATANAAAEVSGLVWAIGPAGIELIATDRYWLSHRRLEARVSGAPGRAIISAKDAERLARACARRGEVHLVLTGGSLSLHDAEDEPLARAALVERVVPDLGLLVATQPPARAVAGFARAELRELLARPEQGEQLHLSLARGTCVLRADGARVLEGWDSPTSGADEEPEVLLGWALLAAAVSVCAGDEVTLSLVDAATPVRVGSPVQDTATCLVMPMRA